MSRYTLTDYFAYNVLRRRPYIQLDWCVRAIEQPIRIAQQRDGRTRFWCAIPEMDGRYLRVVTLADRVTIHNAFFDRGFKP